VKTRKRVQLVRAAREWRIEGDGYWVWTTLRLSRIYGRTRLWVRAGDYQVFNHSIFSSDLSHHCVSRSLPQRSVYQASYKPSSWTVSADHHMFAKAFWTLSPTALELQLKLLGSLRPRHQGGKVKSGGSTARRYSAAMNG